MTTLDVWVSGRPRTKGSLNGGRTGAGAVRLADTPQSKAWRAAICNAVVPLVADEMPEVPPNQKGHWRLRAGWPRAEVPVTVTAQFYFRRSRNDQAARPISEQYGDLDKLMRNVLDALQDSGVYRNDSQVVAMDPAPSKWFAGDDYMYRDGARNEEGARIWIWVGDE